MSVERDELNMKVVSELHRICNEMRDLRRRLYLLDKRRRPLQEKVNAIVLEDYELEMASKEVLDRPEAKRQRTD